MSERINGLVQLLPGKSSLNECSLEELQHLSNRYPYFAPAQLLLLQKLKETGSPESDVQQSKTVLYFHDALQYDYFTSPDRFNVNESRLSSSVSKDVDKPLHQNKNIQPQIETSAFSLAETAPDVAEVRAADDEQKNLVSKTSNQPAEALQPLPAVQSSIVNKPAFSEPDKVTDDIQIAEAEPAVLPAAPLQEKPSLVEQKAEVAYSVPPSSGRVSETPIVLTPEMTTSSKEKSEPEEAGKTELAASAQPVSQPNAEPLAFEPFHTIDYFASQGIKVTADELPKDKLTKQLRSFTEWLKVMKRLPAAEMQQSPESSAEKTVENMATHSVEGSDVVTEAMAEVWAKQGNRQKAIETYNKLSLHNPSKKAYFASKIENLSGT